MPSAQDGLSTRDLHWAVRRYVSPVEGGLGISGQLAHTNGWVYVQATGTSFDSVIYIFLAGMGDGYIDDLKVVAGSVAGAGANLLANGDFESGSLSPWTISTNLSGSATTT